MSLGPSPAGDTADVVLRDGAENWLRRMRLERQLHDGASLRISALSLRLGLLRHQGSEDGTADTAASFQASIGELQDELHAVLEELRDVAGQIYPPLLDQAGLGPALRELADQIGVDVSVAATGERFGPVAEGAAYFAVAECLRPPFRRTGLSATTVPNRSVRVVAHRDGELLVLSLSGIDACHAERVEHHARPLGGSVDVTAVTDVGGVPSGCTITMRIPCE